MNSKKTIDELIEIHIFNSNVTTWNAHFAAKRQTDVPIKRVEGGFNYIPRYSEKIEHAWELVDKLKIEVIPQSEGAPQNLKYMCAIDERPIGERYEHFAETAPLAICEIALIYKGVLSIEGELCV